MKALALAAACGALLLTACQKKDAAPAATPTPVAPKAAAPTGGASHEETAEYAVSLTAKAGGGEVLIVAKPPLHINPEYPTSFRPEGSTVKFEGEKVALVPTDKKPCAAKADDTCEATSPLKYEGAAGGQVAGVLQFSVCEPERCLMEKVKLAATVQ